MLINEDFFDDSELDIQVQHASNSEYEEDSDINYRGLIGLNLSDLGSPELAFDEKFNKKLDRYEKAFRLVFESMGFDVKFDKMLTLKFSEVQALER